MLRREGVHYGPAGETVIHVDFRKRPTSIAAIGWHVGEGAAVAHLPNSTESLLTWPTLCAIFLGGRRLKKASRAVPRCPRCVARARVFKIRGVA